MSEPSPTSRRILLVRHGQSEWNAVGKWQGQADPPLTDLGVEQAARAAETLLGAEWPQFDAVASSTLERAHHTALVIARRHDLAEPLVRPELMERDAGEYSGLTRAEIEEQYPGNLEKEIWPPGWEDDQKLLDRIYAGLKLVLEQLEGQNLVVVGHGGLLYALERMLGAPQQRVSNLGGRWFTIADVDTPATWELGDRMDLLPAADQTIPDQI